MDFWRNLYEKISFLKSLKNGLGWRLGLYNKKAPRKGEADKSQK